MRLKVETLKRCKRCGRDLPTDNFKMSMSTEDGYAKRCRECNTEHYQMTKEKSPKCSIVDMDWAFKTDKAFTEKVKRIKYS